MGGSSRRAGGWWIGVEHSKGRDGRQGRLGGLEQRLDL